ncbi:MAG: glycine C-acetyltransferase [Candidatus Thermoplasmatota archaeon]|nr:glycine C-acetyltransferase [Euryarchaeota archaeon]MBU4032240.1 glycine C-acetyltransferase [Candidatus Thermoplasmatota archaeon]MBU4070715.1 glycine C-acetyltransferase [Candidatus Thermoplasmatota archaeon]MBU4144427.1 glycine C-acetyltransferase [Candidatus Thermoplasmatota archaeon]MBU4591087.1 glycine C-acetyltransferase [Candidatus Thermoplasmatota archaeon]
MKRNPNGFLREEYQSLVEKSFNWQLRTLEGPSAPVCKVDGNEVIMLCSNNYLNLSNHPKIKRASKKAIDTHGAGSGSVRAIAGSMDLHFEAEKRVAKFKRTESALIYQTGFAANAGLIPQLVEKGDIIISDELNHGSIIDGVRLSKADKGVFKHSDMGDLENVLRDADSKGYRRILIITDGVFSMDGDIAHADQIVKLAQQYGAMTYVDDAHGEGVIGPDGRGVGAHFGIEGKIDVEMGTFSKAYGVVGGLIAGSQDLVNYAYNKSRTWLLSGSHPPAVAAAQIAAIEVLETEPRHVKRLWKNTRYFKKNIKRMGFDTGHSETPIIPLMCGESAKAKELSAFLYKEGIFALPIIFPMVARDKARIRIIMNAGLKREHLDKALDAFERGGKKVGII